MSLNDAMTALMDKFREKTNLTNKLSIQRATSLMDHLDLHVNPNLLSNVTELTGDNFILVGGQIVDYNGYKVFETDITWSQVVIMVTIDSGVYTLSEYVSGPLNNGCISFYLQSSDGSQSFQSDNNIAVPDDGQMHRIAYTFEVNTKGTYRMMFTNIKREALPKLEVGDLATPLTEMGGGNSTQPVSSVSEATSSASLQATQPASSASQSTQPVASSATR